jgi:signal transduction histidine kinase
MRALLPGCKIRLVFNKMVSTQTLELFYSSALELLEAATLEQSYKTVVKWAIRLVDGKYGSIFEIKDNIPERVYTSDKRLNQIIPRKNGGTHLAFTANKAFLRSVSTIAPFHPQIKQMKISSDISVPLHYGREKIGVLSVLSPANKPFSQEDFAIMKLYAPLASYSIRQQKLQEDLRNTLAERDLFISMAAHEIKTPLTSLSLYSELMAKNSADKEVVNETYHKKIKYGISRLNSLIEDFLSIQQINTMSIKLKFARVDLSQIVEDSINYFYLQYPKHRVEYTKKDVKGTYSVMGDSQKLQQAFLNILKNAGKYSSSKYPIYVFLSKELRLNKVFITDKGAGITKNDQKHIFEKFYRSKSVHQTGMGLGLFLTKNIIDAHKGSIEIKSRKGKGTTVVVILPDYKNGTRNTTLATKRI